MSTSPRDHYKSERVDPIFLAAIRDALYEYVQPTVVANMGFGYGVWEERLVLDPRLTVRCVDLDPGIVEDGQRRFGESIEFEVGDATTYSPPDAIDTIIAGHLLEHLDDPVRALRHWSSILRPGGTIIAVVPNGLSLHRQIGVGMGMLETLTSPTPADQLVGHRRVYTPDRFQADLEASGLTVVQLGSVGAKSLSNAQLAAMPEEYITAAASTTVDIGLYGANLYAVLQAS